MIDATHAFDTIGAPNNSIQSVVEAIRVQCSEARDPLLRAAGMIEDMVGVVPEIKDARHGRVMAQRIAVMIDAQDHKLTDIGVMIEDADKYATTYLNDPSRAWMWASEPTAEEVAAVSTNIEGVTVQVAVNADTGKIKKGGKQILVLELYKKHVLEATPPLSNQEFIQVVMRDLQMSKAGATTYAWNAKKELGEPEGGIVKAKKGRKPKETA